MTDKEIKRKEYLKTYYQANKDKIKKQNKKSVENNKEKVKEYQKQYREEKPKLKQNSKQYYQDNKDKLKEYQKHYQKQYLKKRKEERETNPQYKLTNNIRSLVSQSIKKSGYKKLSKTEIILGCTFDEFKTYLESKFEDWMNWDNYGNPKDNLFEPNKTWDIDHIIPISSANCEHDIIKLNNFTNLQPLCSYHNRFIKKNILT